MVKAYLTSKSPKAVSHVTPFQILPKESIILELNLVGHQEYS